MSMYIGGIISVIIFYLLILGVGIWAGKKQKCTEKDPDTEEIMLAGRNIGLIVGIFTMTATWVGGGFINGAAEMVYSSGLIWCQAPLGYALSLVFGGFLFARKMRREGYVTMIDPFQRKYGERMGGLLFIPALLGEIFWTAAILSALGGTISVIMKLDNTTSIIISAIVVVVYTLFGGLYSVAYTDVVQLFCIFVGLILSIPFALNHKAVSNIFDSEENLIGEVQPIDICYYIDLMLVLVFGGIPWQVYFQRVLSAKTEKSAMYLSYIAAVGCFVAGIPPIVIGVIAKSTNWTMTGYEGTLPIPSEDEKLILPMVIQYLTPSVISFFGLGAVSAAVMSSADSSVLSASSMFARNIWKLVFRQKASEREILWVMRLGIFFVASLATIMGITITSVYGLWFLCSDLVYVVLFPQLFSVVYIKDTNTYGSMVAYWVGIVLRLSGGEPLFNLPPLIKFPLFDEVNNIQKFPFRTTSMLISFILNISVSYLSKFLFENEYLRKEYDIFKCVTNIPIESIALKDSVTVDEFSRLNISVSNGLKYTNEDLHNMIKDENEPKPTQH
ncbi:High-affinity choline transporter 1 [Brachionus plicatilis]|uniref:High-affinity choline transporter 1 n=1 Tax=Brachionus plicatilis TaxID=10195 RepID=A0A3M7QXH0_BRAPC|nr:High-affinity choline transporter 1 [Brachionus plicatilis]